MKKFRKYLLTPSETLADKMQNVMTGCLICIVWIAIVIAFYQWLFAKEPIGLTIKSMMMQVFPIFEKYKHPFAIEFYTACILAPFGEELVFRHFPLQFMKKKGKKMLMPTILFTSVIFAWCHDGSVSIPIQGVSGFIMACVYVKNGYSYWSSFAMHLFWNLSLTISIYAFLN